MKDLNAAIEILKNRTFIVFGVEHYNPLGLVRTLGEAGILPCAIIVKSALPLASKSKYIARLHLVESIEAGYEVLRSVYGVSNEKDFVLTADDKITSFLDERFDELSDRFYFFNAGENGRISKYMDKDAINKLALKHGLNVLSAVSTEKGIVPDGLDYPVITKAISPTSGAWKGDMHICNNEEELKDSYSRIQSPTVLIQKYLLKKNEYCLEGFSASRGRITCITIASTYAYQLPMTYSPLMTVRAFHDPDIESKLKSMLKEIGFEGIFEAEFLVASDGTLYFSEINFRNSTWSYASTCAGMPLAVLWAGSTVYKREIEGWKRELGDGFTAMVEPADFIERVRGKKVGIGQWLGELRRCGCRYYLGHSDWGPVIAWFASRLRRR